MKTLTHTKLFSAIILAATLLLTSCGNKQDFAYNEKITHDFYSCKERLDDTHAKFLDGGYDNDPEARDLNSMVEFVNETKSNANELEHSEHANQFHASVTEYMTKFSDEYIPLIQNYAKEQDSTKRVEITQQVNVKKSELEAIEDKSLESQIEFLNKAGIKINPNQ